MGAALRALAQGDLVGAVEEAAALVIPVFVINLRRSADRRAFMAESLAKAGVAPEFVAAVDGRACRSQRPTRGLSRAETALVLSHRRVWRRVLRSGAEHAVVLEDDAHVGEDFAALLAADWRGLVFDVVKLETLFDRVWIARRSQAMAGREARRLGAEHLASAGYLVSRAGAAKFLARTRALSEPVDHSLFGREAVFGGEVVAYQIVPAAVVQDNLLPDVAARREMATTLHEGDRVAAVARREKPRGVRRLAREARRLFEQMRRIARLWPRMKRERVEFR